MTSDQCHTAVTNTKEIPNNKFLTALHNNKLRKICEHIFSLQTATVQFRPCYEHLPFEEITFTIKGSPDSTATEKKMTRANYGIDAKMDRSTTQC